MITNDTPEAQLDLALAVAKDGFTAALDAAREVADRAGRAARDAALQNARTEAEAAYEAARKQACRQYVSATAGQVLRGAIKTPSTRVAKVVRQ